MVLTYSKFRYQVCTECFRECIESAKGKQIELLPVMRMKHSAVSREIYSVLVEEDPFLGCTFFMRSSWADLDLKPVLTAWPDGFEFKTTVCDILTHKIWRTPPHEKGNLRFSFCHVDWNIFIICMQLSLSAMHFFTTLHNFLWYLPLLRKYVIGVVILLSQKKIE